MTFKLRILYKKDKLLNKMQSKDWVIKVCKLINRYIIIRRISSFFIIIFSLLITAIFILCIGGWGVVSDLEGALEEMEYLEKKGLLTDLPDDVSYFTRRQVEICGNSSVLRGDIRQHEVSLVQMEKFFYACIILLILVVVIRVLCKYKISKRRMEWWKTTYKERMTKILI